jgi:protein TonB
MINALSPLENRFSRPGLATVVGAHLLVVFALLQIKVISLPAPLAVLSISLIPPAVVPATPRPEIVPPKPKPVARQPRPLTPLAPPVQLAVPENVPTPSTSAVPPAPTFSPPSAPVAMAAAPTPAATPARFDADYLDNPKPVYPAISRRMREEGRVLLRVRVDASGQAQGVELHTSSGYARLDSVALATVARWKFVPARLGSESVAATVLVPIVFSLRD